MQELKAQNSKPIKRLPDPYNQNCSGLRNYLKCASRQKVLHVVPYVQKPQSQQATGFPARKKVAIADIVVSIDPNLDPKPQSSTIILFMGDSLERAGWANSVSALLHEARGVSTTCRACGFVSQDSYLRQERSETKLAVKTIIV